jgi:hypothetical protein
MVTIRFTNNQKGRFMLKRATINLPQDGAGAIECNLAEMKVTLPEVSAVDRWYKDNDLLIQCPIKVPAVEEQTKRFAATLTAEYYYEVSKSGEVLIDTASIAAKCTPTTTTTTAPTTTTTSTTIA